MTQQAKANTGRGLRVLMVTSEWPTPEKPRNVPFMVRQVEALRKTGVDVKVFAFQGRKNPVNYAAAWLRLRLQYRWRDFDLVHIQFGQSGLIALPTPLPLVVTFRGSDVQGIVQAGGRYTLAGRVLRAVSQWVARQADAVVVVAQHLAEQLPHGVTPQVIPAGLDLERFRPMPQGEARRALGLLEDEHLVLFAASPSHPVKRYELAQQTIERTKERLPDVKLVVLEGVPHADVPLYMNACDALLLTSRHEGSPNVVKEALACNLPVVAVDVGDVRARLDGIEGCVVCTEATPDVLAEALVQVLGRRGRVQGRVAVQALDERQLTARLIDIYSSVLPRPVDSSAPAPLGTMEQAY